MTKSIPLHKQHWRQAAGKKYLVGEEFQGQDVTLTITDVKKEEITDQAGKKSIQVVLLFKETDRKIIIGAVTNFKALSRVTGSQIVGDWIGHKVTFTTEKGKWFGKESEAIRIKEDHSNVKV